ncbi:MAG: type 4a pilus biogenesis protein PilO [Planctomycetota bacterium]
MSSSRHLLMAIAAFLLIVATGGMLLVYPNARETRAINSRTAELEKKIRDLTGPKKRVERLADQVGESRRRIERDFKVIPDSPDMAGLIRNLSLPVDGRNVRDQMFTTGNASPAIPETTSTALAMPLMVEMKGAFESVFALLQAAESMDRLVRITMVRVSTNRAQQGDPEVPVLSATIGLDAIYESVASEEAR